MDNLILAQIAYVDFTDIVPAPGSIETITIAEAADTFLIPMMRRRLRNANLS